MALIQTAARLLSSIPPVLRIILAFGFFCIALPHPASKAESVTRQAAIEHFDKARKNTDDVQKWTKEIVYTVLINDRGQLSRGVPEPFIEALEETAGYFAGITGIPIRANLRTGKNVNAVIVITDHPGILATNHELLRFFKRRSESTQDAASRFLDDSERIYYRTRRLDFGRILAGGFTISRKSFLGNRMTDALAREFYSFVSIFGAPGTIETSVLNAGYQAKHQLAEIDPLSATILRAYYRETEAGDDWAASIASIFEAVPEK